MGSTPTQNTARIGILKKHSKGQRYSYHSHNFTKHHIDDVKISLRALGPVSHPADGLLVGNDADSTVGKYKTKKFTGTIKELILDIK